MVPPSARFPTRRAALAEEAARRALAGLGPELVLPQLRQNQLRPKPGQRPAGGFFRQGGAPGGETCRRWNHGSSLRVVINGAKPVAFTPARCQGKDSMPEKYRQRPYSY